MTSPPDIRIALLLSVQRALLGQVPPNLRQVSCGWEGNEIQLQFVFDGPISDDHKEDMRVVGTEVISDFAEPWIISEDIKRLDFPADPRLMSLPAMAYARREDRNRLTK